MQFNPRSRLMALLVAGTAVMGLAGLAAPAHAQGGFASNPVTIGVGAQPRGLAVDPVTHTVYVANKGPSTVSVISEATNRVIATVSLPAGSAPEGVAWDSDTNTIWVADNNGTVSVIGGTTLIKTITINVNGSGQNPSRVVVDTTDHLVFVGLWYGYIVSIPDNNPLYPVTLVYSSKATTHIQLGAYDPNTGLLYASAWDTHEIYEITKTGTVAGTLSSEFGVAFNGVPMVPEVDPVRAELFTGSAGQPGDAFSNINNPPGFELWASGAPANMVPADTAIDGPTGVVYIASDNAGIGEVDAVFENGTSIGQTAVGVGASPYSIVVDPADGPTGTVFVSNYGTNSVTAMGA